ncbi:MAG TPA: TA system VapC family ribonuclease toxin [Verrucomicrobiae bacterium]
MKHLLDVNVLLAAIWAHHPRHSEAFAWLEGKKVVLCPLSELGFLRISAHKKAMGIPMEKARRGLATFRKERDATWIAADLPALDSAAESSEQVTDHYLADLAAKHGHKLATLDEGINHASVEIIR